MWVCLSKMWHTEPFTPHIHKYSVPLQWQCPNLVIWRQNGYCVGNSRKHTSICTGNVESTTPWQCDYNNWITTLLNQKTSKTNYIFSNFSSPAAVLISLLFKRFIFLGRWSCQGTSLGAATKILYFHNFVLRPWTFIHSNQLHANYASTEAQFYRFWGTLAYHLPNKT